MLREILLFFHVLGAIGAVGINVSYFFWLRRAALVPESRGYTLETVRMLELRLAIPAYVIALLTGLWLVVESGREWSTPWIELSILLWIVVMGIGGFHSRLLKRQIAIGDSDSDAYAAGHRRSRILMIALTLSALAMLCLMVFKPTLWG